MTKICIYGAGAIGGYLGARLAATDAEVSLVARGPHLAAIRDRGLILEEGGERTTVDVTATDDPRELGAQDYAIVSLKAHSIPPVVDDIKTLLGPETAVVFAVNGVPWWYFHKAGGAHDGYRLESVDPGGVIWDGIGPERAIGGVVYIASEISEPGLVHHLSGDRCSLGEPSGERSDRARALSEIMIAAGLKAPVRPRIRDEIWVKLLGNASLNPISALTGATVGDICTDPGTRPIVRAIMEESKAVGEAVGAKFSIGIDKRLAGAEAVGDHRTSMLQDLDAGRPMEIDALVKAVQELGRLAGVETPTLDIILALVVQRARVAGTYPA